MIKMSTYVVRPGDTLTKIGRLLKIDWKSIAHLNDLSDPYPLLPGQILEIPDLSGSRSRNGEEEPAHDYSRTVHGGKTVNTRTAVMLRNAEALVKTHFTLAQGSYNRGVAASAGTHDGGGVIDISLGAWDNKQTTAIVQALRRTGFAAWERTVAQGFSSRHIHACAIGDREMMPVARHQVTAYFNYRDGLARNREDTTPHPFPAWSEKYR
ncbi:LysM peptidoglycan-binding domain-containing protein [Streptomyces sp. NPDC098789]|uniref:LysM peptidoglycan-binding domain-containing protein n=1 Tax=Streptomyces sp. NPDC098789 TaxID=3366098 RepID=UPI0038288240